MHRYSMLRVLTAPPPTHTPSSILTTTTLVKAVGTAWSTDQAVLLAWWPGGVIIELFVLKKAIWEPGPVSAIKKQPGWA